MRNTFELSKSKLPCRVTRNKLRAKYRGCCDPYEASSLPGRAPENRAGEQEYYKQAKKKINTISCDIV